MIKKSKNTSELQDSLSFYNNMPHKDGLSPVQWLFGRSQKTVLPTVPQQLARLDDETLQEAENKKLVLQKKAKIHYDKRTRELPILRIGTKVRIRHPKWKTWKQTGQVIGYGNTMRSYKLKADNGAVFFRNRLHIKKNFVTQKD